MTRAAYVLLVLLTACGTKPSVPAAGLPDATLPDLSRTEKSVQEQIEASYRTLQSKPNDADAYGAVGNLLLAAEYYDGAEPFYLHAQALAPDDVRWPYYLGHVYMNRASPDKAITSFERVLQLKPGDVAALVWLGTVRLDQGQPELAGPLFQQAASVQPAAVAALFGAGQSALATRDYSRAVDFLERALAADPRATIVHYPLALAYRGLGDTAKAESHLRQRGTVEVAPPDPLMVAIRDLLASSAAEEERGDRALNGRDYNNAVAHFTKALESAPDKAPVRHKLATALSLAGDSRAAIEQLQETIRRSPNFAPARYSLGVLWAQDGRLPEATEQFAAAVHADPAFPAARYAYALALLQTKRYEDARKQLADGASRFPDHKEFAEALARLGGTP
jgi:tetratricopeptide (TPR) repeat protein